MLYTVPAGRRLVIETASGRFGQLATGEYAQLSRRAGSGAAYTHQMELRAWYEREAEKLRGKLASREQKGG